VKNLPEISALVENFRQGQLDEAALFLAVNPAKKARSYWHLKEGEHRSRSRMSAKPIFASGWVIG